MSEENNKNGNARSREKRDRILYFFPFQLLILHLKRNHLLLVFWLIILGFVSHLFGVKYGIPYLFLAPEYLDKVDYWSYAILGFSAGGFIMAFNIYSYVLYGYLFPFIATVARPFMKFSINNFIIPAIVIVLFLYNSYVFQVEKELIAPLDAIVNLIGFLSGMTVFFFISAVYFFRTNKDVFKIKNPKKRGRKRRDKFRHKDTEPVDTTLVKKVNWYDKISKKGAWRVETYMSSPFKIRLTRGAEHYDEEILQEVLSQNHINASLFEVVLLISFLTIGSFRDTPAFEIPAGASVFLLFTMFLMLFSAFYSWFKGWTLTVLVVLFLIINYASTKTSFIRMQSHAFGLNYDTEKVDYSNETLLALRDNEEYQKEDIDHTLHVLKKWLLKNSRNSIELRKKPKLVIINTSGGGIRASFFTMHSLLYADKMLDGELLNHTFFITGSSGGMIGAAYLRELYLRHQVQAIPLYDEQYLHNISRDILNPVAFAMATHDLFIRYQTFEHDGKTYLKDRGYAFEKQLNKNTDFLLDKRLIDYKPFVDEAVIPMMVFSPTVVNDGRRMLISSQGISYLTNNKPDSNFTNVTSVEDIEFMRLFKDQDAREVKFTSVLRMSATFPYIMPSVTLPTDPFIEVMDAGARDNYGIRNSIQFLYAFRNWISTNTSGVVMIQIRDRQEDFVLEKGKRRSITENMLSPLGSFYGNFPKVQDYNNDKLIQYASRWFEGKLDVITLQLRHTDKDNISLSWHLTKLEKNQIINTIYSSENQKELTRLKKLLE